jgi:hypothetical protein
MASALVESLEFGVRPVKTFEIDRVFFNDFKG